MEPSAEAELDPELEQWLADAREDEGASAISGDDLSGLLGEVRAEQEKADASPLFWLRSRATWMRRAIALSITALVVVLAGAFTLRADFAALPAAFVAVSLASLAVLLGASVFLTLRPLHRPPMSPALRYGLAGATVAATLAIALFSPAHAPTPDMPLFSHVSPCLFYGLFAGLPVYVALRLLDRRAGSTLALLGACAAGLTGNLVLSLHCPRNDVEHLMGGHFSVVLVFLAGLGALHWLLRRRE